MAAALLQSSFSLSFNSQMLQILVHVLILLFLRNATALVTCCPLSLTLFLPGRLHKAYSCIIAKAKVTFLFSECCPLYVTSVMSSFAHSANANKEKCP